MHIWSQCNGLNEKLSTQVHWGQTHYGMPKGAIMSLTPNEPIYVQCNEWGELDTIIRWASWVWEITGWKSKTSEKSLVIPKEFRGHTLN